MSDINEPTQGEGSIARRRRIVRDFLRALLNFGDDIRKFYTFETLLDQLTLKEVQWTLIETLEDEDVELRLAAAIMLLQLGENLREAERAFVEQLEGENPLLSFKAAVLLAGCDRVPEAAVPALLAMFKSQNWFCRVAAATALVDHDPAAVPVLAHALRGGEDSVVAKAVAEWTRGQGKIDRVVLDDAKSVMIEMLKNLAACAVGRRGVRCPEAVRALVEGLEHGSPDVKLRNVFLLLRMGPQAADALPSLVKLLESRETGNDLRQAIAGVIGKIGGSTAAGKALVRPLVRALKSGDWAIANNVVLSLEAIGESPGVAMRAMARQLEENPDPMARRMAAACLGRFGPSAVEFVPALIECARRESDRDVWMSFANAIVAIGPPAIPCLVEAIVQGDVRVIQLAGVVLSEIGVEAARELAHAMLIHPDQLVRRHFAAILRLMGPRAKSAVPIVIELLRDSDDEKRLDAVMALGAMGHEAAEAAPDLADSLSDKNADIREFAENALVAIGPEALPALETAFRNADERTRERITRIAARLGRMVGQRTNVPDFKWIGDDRLLECFVIICQIFERTGIRSVQGAAKEMGRMQSRGELDDTAITKYGRVKSSLNKLEKLLNRKEGRTFRLTSAHATRPEGLTDDGRRYFGEFRDYLEMKRKSGQ